MTDPLEILQQYWGHEAFRPLQLEVIDSVLKGNDTLALMPTGGGKSLTYQIPAIAKEGICLVITPLIALMNDQVEALNSRNIKAAAIHSGLDHREIDVLLDSCIYGAIKLLYCAPERLKTSLFLERLVRMDVNLIAVDEAHCISQWGHDFRPSYLEISDIRELLPEVPLLAVTATATPKVQEEILAKLRFKNPAVFQQSFLRPNLSLSVRWVEDKESKLKEILSKIPGSAIVYVKIRRQAKELAMELRRDGVSCDFYHAGLDPSDRQQRQTDWRLNKFRVMIATNAFGMGIDKAEVRLVVHMNPPNSLEAYYQEAGRAGRDGKRAYAVLLVQAKDEKLLMEQLTIAHPDIPYLKHIYQCLSNYYRLAIGSGENEAFDFDLSEFTTRYNLQSLKVFNALKRLGEDGLFKYTDSLFEPSRLKIMVDSTELYKFQVANERFDDFIKSILRLYGGQMFSEYLKISEHKLGQFVEMKSTEVIKLLARLDELEVISYIPKSDSARITFLKPRQDAKALSLDTQRLRQLLQTETVKVNEVIRYFKNEEQCRMAFILNYFGEKFTACGICDVCLAKEHAISDEQVMEGIRAYLMRGPASTANVVDQFLPNQAKQVLSCIRQLMEAQEVAQSGDAEIALL